MNPKTHKTLSMAVAVDIGGTFTDIVVHEPATGSVITHKVLSTPEDAGLAVAAGLRDVVDLREVSRFVHGTTVGLNAILSRSGSRALVITTAGFRDLLHVGRAERTDIWKLDYKRPRPIVPLTDIHTMHERIDASGTIIEPLDESDLDPIFERVAREQITSVAVCFLHSCRNPVHEKRVRDRLRSRFPELVVSLSHEVAAEVREYERFSTTSLNAYIAEPVARYLGRLRNESKSAGYEKPLFVMRSSGGVTSAEIAECSPIQTLLSGPAGGVVGAEMLARALARPNLIAVDMGGTSLDASLIIDARMSSTSSTTLEELPVLMPVVDLVSIGAGGGSIAWIEAGGLRVGPQSAGALPGPVCYGRGGTQPTVTDANVALGRIDPDFFLGGAMRLDIDGAHLAIKRIADDLGLDLMGAAEGIVAVTNARMADALRTLTVRRGHDPRDFSLLVFGGAGPLHGAALATELDIHEVIVPLGTGVFSAWGMLHAPVRHDVSAPLLRAMDELPLAELRERFAGLKERGKTLLRRDGVRLADAIYAASADMRYLGQEFFINVEGEFGHRGTDWQQCFHKTYQRLHGHSTPESPVEIVNLRVTACGPELDFVRAGGTPAAPPPTADREIFVDGRTVTARIFRRDGFDGPVSGPAIIEEPASTTFVPPSWEARRGPIDTIVLTHVGGP